jgi:soluble lytic murein transglycosylase
MVITLKQKIIAAAVVLLVIVGGFAAKFCQTPAKTDAVYKHALQDYEKEDFSNAYFLFAKVTPFSNLKPVALFRQAQCAEKIDDKKSALKKYKAIFTRYPKHKLSMKAKYLYAVEVYNSDPQLAQKYFEEIIKKYPESDCAVAAEYFLGLIITDKYKSGKMPLSEKNDAQSYFRHYLKQAPGGRWALNAVNTWLVMDDAYNPDDALMFAKTYYSFGDYEKTGVLLSTLTRQESWTLDVQNSYAMKNFARAKAVAENGLKNYSKYANDQDVYDVIDTYLQITDSKLSTIDGLLAVADKSGKGADYLLYLKCNALPVNEKEACYTQFYGKYPDTKFSADVLASLFFEKIRKKDYANAQKIGKDHLQKFANVNSTPMVMFWLGKTAQRTNDFKAYNAYYNAVITKFPDSFYAYRAYLNLNHIESPLISKTIKEAPVEFPYKNSKNNIILKLVELNDYEIISELSDDEFVKSWVSYKKGDYSKSAIQARNAMDKLAEKPNKFDLRWRLVYPLTYYDTVKKYAGSNNPQLMQSILREESYFDPMAMSFSGARGLMQLMPATADEVNAQYGLGASLPEGLYEPAANIKLGCFYYLFLKKELGYDVSSIAAYNGGIGSLKRWKTSLDYGDTDEFIEQIPYPETQNYVKKVFRSYWNYVRLYQ